MGNAKESLIKIRESNFELLRIVSMFFIVLYHLLLYFVVEEDGNILYKAIYLPLHVAVICFVLISGFFHIKPSLKGFTKILLPLILFYLPLTLFEKLYKGYGGGTSFLFISNSPYWFVRTYLYLYLVAPMLNSYLTSNKRRVYILLVLGGISVYMGMMHDKSLIDGKNLPLFMFLYVVGDSIHAYIEKIQKIKVSYLIFGYVFLNVILFFIYVTSNNSWIGNLLWRFSFPYCSPILIFNAVLLFLIFSKISFHSKIVNWISASMFAIYILHQQHYVLYDVMGPLTMKVYALSNTPLVVLLLLALLTFLFMTVFVFIDKLFSPLQTYILIVISKIEKKGALLEIKNNVV